MNIYFIDYENVTSQGLKGIELLTEADEVNLLYSKKAETMKIDMLTQLMASRANIRFLPVHVGTPNALDFQLITLLFLRYTDGNNYYIISKDSGYDCCIKTALENDAPNVFRFPNIESAVNGGQKPKSQRSRRGSRQNSQNNSQAAAQVQNAVQEQKAAQAQNAVQEAAQDADIKQDIVADTVQVQESISSQVQNLNDTPVQDLINTPAQSQDNANAQEAVADTEAAVSEDSGRKRPARRRGRRKSSSASQAEAVSSEESAEVSKELKEEVHEEPSQAKENQNQNQKQNQQQNQQARKNQNQKQNQQAKDSQNHNQKQSQQNRDNQNQKPVTILSVIRRRNDVQLDLNQIDLIRAALKNTANKQQFYNYFAKKLGQKKGIELYHSIKSSYTDLINANLI